MLSVIILNFVILSVILNFVILSFILNFVMLSVIMLNVVAPCVTQESQCKYSHGRCHGHFVASNFANVNEPQSELKTQDNISVAVNKKTHENIGIKTMRQNAETRLMVTMK